jgi:type I restriction enzyme S subunit
MNTASLVGESAYVDADVPDVYLPDRLWQVSPKQHVDAEWFALLVGSPAVRNRLRMLASGTSGSMKNISQEQFRSIRVVVPSPEIQARSAIAARRCNLVIGRLDEVIAAKRTFKRGLMQDLLTGRRRFPEFREDWRSKPLDHLVEIRSGGTPSRRNPQFWGGMIPWVTAKDMKHFHLSFTQESVTAEGCSELGWVAQPGQVLVLVRGNLQGAVPVGVPTRPMTFNQDVKLLEPRDEVSGEFLGRCLGGLPSLLQSQLTITGHGVGRLDTRQLRRVQILFPGRREQERICTVLKQLDREISLLEAAAVSMSDFKRGLMQKLLSGDIEVPQGHGTLDRGPDDDDDE